MVVYRILFGGMHPSSYKKPFICYYILICLSIVMK